MPNTKAITSVSHTMKAATVIRKCMTRPHFCALLEYHHSSTAQWENIQKQPVEFELVFGLNKNSLKRKTLLMGGLFGKEATKNVANMVENSPCLSFYICKRVNTLKTPHIILLSN